MQIGEMLIAEGLLTEDQRNEALEIQKADPKRLIGEIFLELGYIDIEKFTRILDRQLKEQGLTK